MQEQRWDAIGLPALVWLAVAYRGAVPVGNSTDPAAAAARDLPAGMRSVAFAERPNVYFISFDAMVPEATTNHYMDLPGTAYHAVPDAHFTKFSNFFRAWRNDQSRSDITQPEHVAGAGRERIQAGPWRLSEPIQQGDRRPAVPGAGQDRGGGWNLSA